MQELNIDEPFSPAYGFIVLEPNTYVYYRVYKTRFPAISERPAYYGTEQNANSYSGPDRTVSMFTNEKPLKLIDIRFMKDILRELFTYDNSDPDTISVIVSFGLCSLYHQLLLAKARFGGITDGLKELKKTYVVGLYEQPGVRIAETTNDSYTMAFLKQLFNGFIDGFISPIQESAFHITQHGHIPAEIIVFNPKQSGIRMVDTSESVLYTVTMEYLYGRDIGKKTLIKGRPFHFGEARREMPTVERISHEIDDNADIQREWKRGEAAGNKWKKQFDITVLNKTLINVLPWKHKTRRQKKRVDRIRDIPGPTKHYLDRIYEEMMTNPAIEREWNRGEAAGKKWKIEYSTDEPKIVKWDRAKTAGEILDRINSARSL